MEEEIKEVTRVWRIIGGMFTAYSQKRHPASAYVRFLPSIGKRLDLWVVRRKYMYGKLSGIHIKEEKGYGVIYFIIKNKGVHNVLQVESTEPNLSYLLSIMEEVSKGGHFYVSSTKHGFGYLFAKNNDGIIPPDREISDLTKKEIIEKIKSSDLYLEELPEKRKPKRRFRFLIRKPKKEEKNKRGLNVDEVLFRASRRRNPKELKMLCDINPSDYDIPVIIRDVQRQAIIVTMYLNKNTTKEMKRTLKISYFIIKKIIDDLKLKDQTKEQNKTKQRLLMQELSILTDRKYKFGYNKKVYDV